MRKALLIPAVAMALIAMMWSPAHASNEFEDGFKTEMGAIAARAAVGLGVGVVHGAVHGPAHNYDYGYNRHVHRRHGHGHRRHVVVHHRHWRGCGHGPRHQRVVVYRPYYPQVRHVEHRVVHHAPGPYGYNF